MQREVAERLQKLPDGDSRNCVRATLREFTKHLEHVYGLKDLERVTYWSIAFYIYNFLRQTSQPGGLSGLGDDVKEMLREILSDS